MRVETGRRLWLTFRLLTGLGIAFAAGTVDAQGIEYVITFDKVVVEGIEGTGDTPEVAHSELPVVVKSSLSTEGAPDRAKRKEPQGRPVPMVTAFPDSLLPFAPAHGTANPSFVQAGFLVESFWAIKTGTSEGTFKGAHFHPADLSTGFEAQHLGNPNELHGIYIRSLDGKPFGLKSLRYRVTRNRQLPNKPLSIEGFSNFSVNVLVARSFDPRVPVRAQFIPFAVGLPAGNQPDLPWWTVRILGFEVVNKVYIASSASVDFDDIVLTRIEPPSPPFELPEEDK